jgi:hypothetical protein
MTSFYVPYTRTSNFQYNQPLAGSSSGRCLNASIDIHATITISIWSRKLVFTGFVKNHENWKIGQFLI